MAKKRKEKTDEEELDFKIPKFDEQKFIGKEKRNIKTLFISFIIGLTVAFISYGFWTLLRGCIFRWELILLLGVFCSPWLRYLFMRLDIDLTEFGRKGWFGSYAIYFFTWLVILIILVNPPFTDEEKPVIDMAVLPGVQEPGGTIHIYANIMDNVCVEEQDITFAIPDPNGSTFNPDFEFVDNLFRYTYENSNNLLGEYAFTLLAEDVNGHKNEQEGTFEYSEDALRIISSRFTDIRSGDAITINADEKISSGNFRVYYRINNGSEINVDRKNEDDKEKYATVAEYEGWSTGSIHFVKIYAEVTHYFLNNLEEYSNIVVDTERYNFSTSSDDNNIGTEPTLVEFNYTLAAKNKKQLPHTLNYKLPRPTITPVTPGFEIIAFILSLVVVVFIFKFRKKDKKK